MKAITRTVRIGSNRGTPRLWLEGQWLADLGFSRGEPFMAVWTEGTITLRLVDELPTERCRRVSGKGDRPIIDIAGANLLPFVGAPLTLTGRPGVLTIRRAS